jgi:hypothetical protein
MKTPIQRKSKLILLFSAVLVFQCCCCIIPYSWGLELESFTLASPFQQEEEIHPPLRESLNAEIDNEKNPVRLNQSIDMNAGYTAVKKDGPFSFKEVIRD